MMGQDMGRSGQERLPDDGRHDGLPARGMKQGMGHGAMMHSVPMMEGRLAYIKADLEITDAQTGGLERLCDAVTGPARRNGKHACRYDESQRERERP